MSVHFERQSIATVQFRHGGMLRLLFETVSSHFANPALETEEKSASFKTIFHVSTEKNI